MAAILVIGSLGFDWFQRSRPFPVLVRDAETKQPIVGAQISICYRQMGDLFAPRQSKGRTSEKGMMLLEAVPYRRGAGIWLTAEAAGYILQDEMISPDAIDKIQPQGLFEPAGQREIAFVVELFSEPSATIELVLPNGYRGLVAAKFEPLADGQLVPGQREFSYRVPASGVVIVRGPKLLTNVHACKHWKAHYDDGTPLPTVVEPSRIGLRSVTRYITFKSFTEFYAVGTAEDERAWYWRLNKRADDGGTTDDLDAMHRIVPNFEP